MNQEDLVKCVKCGDDITMYLAFNGNTTILGGKLPMFSMTSTMKMVTVQTGSFVDALQDFLSKKYDDDRTKFTLSFDSILIEVDFVTRLTTWFFLDKDGKRSEGIDVTGKLLKLTAELQEAREEMEKIKLSDIVGL